MIKGKENTFWWYLPLIAFIIILISVGAYYLFLEKQVDNAKQQYDIGEKKALLGEYEDALLAFKSANDFKEQFPSAIENEKFMKVAITIKDELKQADKLLEDNQYQQSLQLISTAEGRLKDYDGELVSILQHEINRKRHDAQIQQLNVRLASDPPIDELKTLLWEAEAIQSEDAEEIASSIREQIVAYVFSTASEQLSNKQYTDARNTVQDGLEYVPNSEKLKSFKTTIEKEKTAFETAQQQRIEQAIIAAEEEREINKNDAVELLDIKVLQDEQKNLVVTGDLKSVATVPIHTVSVDYVLLDPDENEILSNEVYVYPETLYPEEEGKFDYTHFDIGNENMNLKVKIEKISWFLD
ncbi:hypothetical protein JOC48_002703 [Aquibacillus albus]|uniref:Uncharacterized protein n=2 Tax=Aquibacillus albus TaxID=1168171 RepID=A0ABS2N250_9BACI|nr:hypothetical protein [Aquibacillus albus]